MCRPWMRRLSSVTPTGMFSSQAANAAAGRLTRMAASALLTIFTIDASAPDAAFALAPLARSAAKPARGARYTRARYPTPRFFQLKRGRFVHIPHQLVETRRQAPARV